MTTAVDPRQVPVDAPIKRVSEIVTKDGASVSVRGLSLGTTFRVVGAITKAGIKSIPAGLVLGDFVTPEQRAAINAAPSEEVKAALIQEAYANLSVEQKRMISESNSARTEAIVDLVVSSDGAIEALIGGCTNLKPAEISALSITDALAIIAEVLELTGVHETVEAVVGFIGRIGGLMDAAGRRSETTKQASGEAE
jgi:hypothetical protein